MAAATGVECDPNYDTQEAAVSPVATEYDLTSPAFRADPFPTFAEMRRDAPIYSVEQDSQLVWERGRVWYPMRYQHCLEVLMDPKRFVKDFKMAFDEEQIAAMPDANSMVKVITDSLLSQEDPRHARLRGLVNQAFSPAMIAGKRGRIEEIICDLLDDLLERGEMDLLNDFAFRVPVAVITEILGLPIEDSDQLREWTTEGGVSAVTEEEFQAMIERLEALADYMRKAFAEREANPRDDLITALMQAEVDGERLNEDELISMVVLFVGAGFETTMHTITNGVLNLLRHPDELNRLCQDRSLLDSAVEELLRYEGPLLTATPRWAACDVDFHGVQIRRGDPVFPMLLSANRDEERFEDPDRFDLARQDNRHLALGRGIHFCLGGPLARLEIRCVLDALADRLLPRLRLAVPESELVWAESQFFHGVEALPVGWD